MPILPKRNQTTVLPFWRRSVTPETLQMMVMSGVVRRADLNPPQEAGRKGFQLPEPRKHASPQDLASAPEPGWLSRILLKRKPHAPVAQ